MSNIQLGFCVPVESHDQLRVVGHRTSQWNNWDGGQVGGCPSWLTRATSLSKPTCPLCGETMLFVAQIYAPKDEPHAYHRSLYIFACPKDSRVSVWRFNIPRDNPYWPYDGDAEEDYRSNNNESQLCAVCGFVASASCSVQKLPFCGRVHQVLHYSRKHEGTSEATLKGIFTPIYELAVEEEELELEEDEDGAIVVSNGGDSDALLEQADLNAAVHGQESQNTREDDIMFEKFRDRIASDRMQVLRYGGSPLWMTAQVPDEIPSCGNCGGERCFEFQLMPQLLHFLKAETFLNDPPNDHTSLFSEEELCQERLGQPVATDLDWGIVAVYTCEQSCASTSFVNEYAYVQASISSAEG